MFVSIILLLKGNLLIVPASKLIVGDSFESNVTDILEFKHPIIFNNRLGLSQKIDIPASANINPIGKNRIEKAPEVTFDQLTEGQK